MHKYIYIYVEVHLYFSELRVLFCPATVKYPLFPGMALVWKTSKSLPVEQTEGGVSYCLASSSKHIFLGSSIPVAGCHLSAWNPESVSFVAELTLKDNPVALVVSRKERHLLALTMSGHLFVYSLKMSAVMSPQLHLGPLQVAETYELQRGLPSFTLGFVQAACFVSESVICFSVRGGIPQTDMCPAAEDSSLFLFSLETRELLAVLSLPPLETNQPGVSLNMSSIECLASTPVEAEYLIVAGTSFGALAFVMISAQWLEDQGKRMLRVTNVKESLRHLIHHPNSACFDTAVSAVMTKFNEADRETLVWAFHRGHSSRRLKLDLATKLEVHALSSAPQVSAACQVTHTVPTTTDNGDFAVVYATCDGPAEDWWCQPPSAFSAVGIAKFTVSKSLQWNSPALAAWTTKTEIRALSYRANWVAVVTDDELIVFLRKRKKRREPQVKLPTPQREAPPPPPESADLDLEDVADEDTDEMFGLDDD